MQKMTVYVVTATALEDGHRLNYGWYLSATNAQNKAASMNPKMEPSVLKCDAVQDTDGRVFELPRQAIKFQDGREEILSKLTKEERAILGV